MTRVLTANIRRAGSSWLHPCLEHVIISTDAYYMIRRLPHLPGDQAGVHQEARAVDYKIPG